MQLAALCRLGNFSRRRLAQGPNAGGATLRDPDVLEPTFEEYHPNGTRYESPDAPVSLAHFPTNRCEVHACQRCGQHVLRYTEYGGYYVDPRARRLNPDLIVP